MNCVHGILNCYLAQLCVYSIRFCMRSTCLVVIHTCIHVHVATGVRTLRNTCIVLFDVLRLLFCEPASRSLTDSHFVTCDFSASMSKYEHGGYAEKLTFVHAPIKASQHRPFYYWPIRLNTTGLYCMLHIFLISEPIYLSYYNCTPKAWPILESMPKVRAMENYRILQLVWHWWTHI